MLHRRVRILELLGDDQAVRDHDARGREHDERKADREPQVLRLMGGAARTVDDHEGDGAKGDEREEREHDVLGAPVRGCGGSNRSA